MGSVTKEVFETYGVFPGPELEEALADAGKTYEMIVFDGANHAFFNDTGERFDPEAAEEAWSYTLGWFDEYL